MAIVEETGIYRRADGHTVQLLKGAVVTDDFAEAYQMDGDASIDNPNPTDSFPETPFGSQVGDDVSHGDEVRDGVVVVGSEDAGFAERGVRSAVVADRDAQPVGDVEPDTQREVRDAGAAPENRMAPVPDETRRSRRSTRRAASDASDVELGQDEASDGDGSS